LVDRRPFDVGVLQIVHRLGVGAGGGVVVVVLIVALATAQWTRMEINKPRWLPWTHE